MERRTTLLLVVCLSLLAPLSVAPVAAAEPIEDLPYYCVDLKPDDPGDPVDIYTCDPPGEP